jgi:hypothetical protein
MTAFTSRKQMRLMLTILAAKKAKDGCHSGTLNKNIIRSGQVSEAVHEMAHGDALKLIGNGTFRIIRDAVQGMTDDSIRDVKFGTYTLHIRKHVNDVYSGRIDDGLKTIHQFVNRSIPLLTAELMSVFEWYSEDNFDVEEEEKLPDEVITDGINRFVDNYKNKGISNIHVEMENIREEIRNGVVVDIQQAEQKILKLFDKLSELIATVQTKHNDLATRAGSDLDEIERKLLDLQSKVGVMPAKNTVMRAIATADTNPKKIHDEFYDYLSKPKVVIEPNGRITISFSSDWNNDEKINFLSDMKAKVVKDK